MKVPLSTVIETLRMPYRLIGDPDRVVSRASAILEAQDALAVTFCSKPGEAGLQLMESTRAGVILCTERDDLSRFRDSAKTFVIVSDPRLAFLRIVGRLFAEPAERGIHATAIVDPDAEIGRDVYVGPFTSIAAECSVGDGTVIAGHVSIYRKTVIGRNVLIHSGTVIGAEGFGYQRNELGELEKFPHIGGVIIEDDVEIGSNTSIDRGTLGNTLLKRGARIDNLVHIAHNVVVGRHAAVIAHAMIGGSTIIGDEAWIAPSACIRDGLTIGAKAVVGLGAVVVRNVPEGVTVIGNPARPYGTSR